MQKCRASSITPARPFTSYLTSSPCSLVTSTISYRLSWGSLSHLQLSLLVLDAFIFSIQHQLSPMNSSNAFIKSPMSLLPSCGDTHGQKVHHISFWTLLLLIWSGRLHMKFSTALLHMYILAHLPYHPSEVPSPFHIFWLNHSDQLHLILLCFHHQSTSSSFTSI